MRLYTAGYRDSITEKRLEPELFFSSLPEDAFVVDIRSVPYSPFAPCYTGKGVAAGVQMWKPGVKGFAHIKALGNTRREPSGKRIAPPIYIDSDAGFDRLKSLIESNPAVVIFCACSHMTLNSSRYRCHRFFVAEEMRTRIANLEVIHLQQFTIPANELAG